MTLSFSPEDVRKHLEDLGYKDLTQQQLEEFMRDLRRLLRYEDQHKRIQDRLESIERGRPRETKRDREKRRSSSSSTSSAYSSSSSVACSSQRSSPNRESKRVMVKVEKRSRKMTVHSREDSDGGDATTSHSPPSEKRGGVVLRFRVNAPPAAEHDDVLLRRRRRRLSAGDLGRRRLAPAERRQPSSRIPTRPTTSFIRPPIMIKASAKEGGSDPVRLYKFYRSLWERTKFPGDDSTKQVRWAVREWMMGSKYMG